MCESMCTWPIHTWHVRESHESCHMWHVSESWLIHRWHVTFIGDMSARHMSHVICVRNASRLIRTYDRNESWLIRTCDRTPWQRAAADIPSDIWMPWLIHMWQSSQCHELNESCTYRFQESRSHSSKHVCGRIYVTHFILDETSSLSLWHWEDCHIWNSLQLAHTRRNIYVSSRMSCITVMSRLDTSMYRLEWVLSWGCLV